ncbi:MAG: hypothetical protein ACI9LM_004410 [Alteromonadaceae bacterium]|jgi:hypothetical protein
MGNLTFEQKKMTSFLGKRLTGSSITIKNHHKRALIISTKIYERFGAHVYQYQQKHLLWFLTVHVKNHAHGTRYNYCLTLIKIISLNQKMACWEHVLKKRL